MPDENHNFPFDLFDDGNKNQISVPVANPEVSSDGTRNLRENIQVESADVDNANKENTKKYKPSSEEVADFIEFMLSTGPYAPQNDANKIDEATKAPAAIGSDSFVSSSVQQKVAWFDPQPLPHASNRVPTMTPEMVPETLRSVITIQANLACVPIEMLAVPTISMISGLIGRTALVLPDPMNPAWQVVPNLWSMVVAPPGMLKTPVLQMALHPLRILEEEAVEQHLSELPQTTGKLENVQAKLHKLSRSHRTTDGEFAKLKDEEELLKRQLQPKRYLVVTATTQKLGRILNRNERGVVLMSDELALLLRQLDQAANSDKREFFLKAWSGNDLHAFDTVSSGTVYVRNPCLTIIGAIQPGPLKDHLRRNGAGKSGDHGMLQRFQLAVFPDQLAPWKRSSNALKESDLLRVLEIVRSIDGWWDAQNAVPKVVPFSSDAQPVWYRWQDELEIRLRGSELEKSPAMQSLLLKYRSLIPSLALVFTALKQASCPTANTAPDVIELSELERAIGWSTFLEAHGWKILGEMANPTDQGMRYLAEKIRSQEVLDQMTLRDLGRKKWRGLTETHHTDSD